MRKLRSSYLMTGYCIGILINSTWAQAEDFGKSTNKILNDPRCELHIWPTEAHHAFFGFQFNGLVGAIVDSVGSPSHLYSNDEIEKLTESWLDTPSQLALIETVGLPKLLKLESYKIFVEQPMPGNIVSIKAMDEQLHSNIPNVPCRAEFRIVRITYEKDGWNRSLISYMIYRQIKDGVETNYKKTFLQLSPLKAFPPKTVADTESAKENLQGAFKRNIEMFVAKKILN